MSVLFLFGGAIFFGFLLILLIAVGSPPAPTLTPADKTSGEPLLDLDAEQLSQVVAAILDKMGLEIERMQGGANEVIEIFANNPTPVTGGKFLIHIVPVPEDTGRIDGVRTGAFIRAMRSAYVSKGLLFTAATFSPDAYLEAEDTPAELFDRYKITKLLDDYYGDSEEHPLHTPN